MKCAVCRGSAVIDLRRHNANFCADHFLKFCRDQVARAIEDHDMIEPGDRVLVAVSGGKDSLALWDVLLELGYDTEGMTIGLGIGDYSAASTEAAVAFAEQRGLTLHRVDLRDDYDYDIPTASAVTNRVPCSSCGLSKRHLIDKAALDGGYDVVATGHNLDDEAAVLFGNVLHWHTEYLGRQQPTLAERIGPSGSGSERRVFPRKVKPLVRLAERETAAYCVLRGIDYIVEECPMAEGNRHLRYKEALNAVETASPGAKQAFYFGFLARAASRFAPDADGADGELLACGRCGSPTSGGVCAFCRLVDRVAGHDPVPVELVRPRRGGARRRQARTKARS
jgi:tRNA-5-methyluridine54 2-sulfurtransferase